jgi:hypothetical protein
MIFDNETPIDKHLLFLVQELKKLTRENPAIKITENNWVLTMPKSWLQAGELCVSYYRFHKHPFRVWWSLSPEEITISMKEDDDNVIFDSEVADISQVINSLLLLKYSNQGIPQDVLDYLANCCNKIGMEKAIKSIGKETKLILTLEQMKILGIEEDRGRITGRKFGL